ncbi:MAG TPA: YdeI/OmpD-associated family protein [Opitutaceae bacterium]
MIQFSGKLEVVGINPCVKVPARVTKHFGKRGYVPVIVHLERGRVPSTLVPIGDGAHRLYINGVMLKYTDATPGERVTVSVELDSSDRKLKVPDYLRVALATSSIAQSRWKAFPPSKQQELIRYLSFAKSDETRDRNLKKLIEILNSKSGEGALSGIKITDRTKTTKSPLTLTRE